ncbi:sigma-54-dependent Fis family transcriptional regulator [Amycolatopsis jejuensis]|uniref:sigma-54-dependent Fis family transcriptional regulator n=1 Tax=Amycolatopsis jejuensis TaxID=330084 RepID=UPI00068E4F98|nr:helix-turn-helix domain-containing protein [Amycolatopsis jejuensis]
MTFDRELPSTASAAIRGSWKRSWQAGVRPELALDRLGAVEVDPDSRLLRAARPVLDRVADELSGTAYFTVLADSAARIVHRGRISHRAEAVLDSTGVVLGRQFSEESTGTNGIATPFELRRGMSVRGGEHFAHAMRRYSCYGYPIVHPVTRRLEGVLDLAGRAGDENPLFGPYLRRAVADVERALLTGARESRRRMLHAFEEATARRGERAVLALSKDGEVLLANRTALDHLDASDHSRLRDLPARPGIRFGTANGLDLLLHIEPIDAHGSVLISFVPVYRARHVSGPPRDAVERELTRCRAGRLSTVVVGEPGTGRTTTAARLTDGSEVVTIGCADGPTWLERVSRAAESGALVVVEGFELLGERELRAVGDRIARGAWIALTGPPIKQLGPDHRHLVHRCLGRIELAPLRDRRAEIPALARTLLTEATGGSARFTPAALAHLADLDWPGNLRELAHVVRTAATHRSVGDILVADLPPEYRTAPATSRLTRWDRADHDAIVEALSRSGGNKLQAAKDLGISRGTLYNRIRTLRIKA